MTSRPISLILAAGLLLLIGVSGMAVGGELLGAAGRGAALPGGQGAASAVGFAMAAYGFASVVAGVALVLLHRAGWWFGVAVAVIGLAALVAINLAIGALDEILLFGVAVWGLTLAFLLAPATRRAIRPPD